MVACGFWPSGGGILERLIAFPVDGLELPASKFWCDGYRFECKAVVSGGLSLLEAEVVFNV